MHFTHSPRVGHEQIEAANEHAERFSPERTRLMDLICTVNRSATREFLDGFTNHALRLYCDHLDAASRPRGRDASWVRTAETPAVTWRDAQ